MFFFCMQHAPPTYSRVGRLNLSVKTLHFLLVMHVEWRNLMFSSAKRRDENNLQTYNNFSEWIRFLWAGIEPTTIAFPVRLFYCATFVSIIFFQLYTHISCTKQGRQTKPVNLVLRHSVLVLHFPPNSGGIAYWVAKMKILNI